MSFDRIKDREQAEALADRIKMHIKLKESSLGFHMTDDDLALCALALHMCARQPVDN